MKQELEKLYRIPITDESDNGEVKVKKWKTFEEICPLWNSLLEQGLVPNPRPTYSTPVTACRTFAIGIGEPRFCIVGESHNFNADYYYAYRGLKCNTCFDYSQYLFNHSSVDMIKQYISGFENHWNEVHNT